MKRIAYIGCLGLVGIMTTEFGIVGILPQVAQHYRLSIERAGLLLSVFALVIALTGPLMTLLAAGTDRKKIMLMSLALFLFTGVVSACAPPFWLLLVVRVLPAFLQPVYIATAIAAALDTADEREAPRLMALVLTGTPIATVATIPLATYLAGQFGWQASFGVQAAVSAVALLGIWGSLPALPVREKKSYRQQLGLLANARFLVSCGMNFLLVAAWFSTYSYFADYLGTGQGLSPKMVSYLLLVFGVAGVLGNWLAGKLLSHSIPLTTAFFLAGSVLLPLGFRYAPAGLPGTLGLVAFWGLMYGPAFLTASAYLISAAPGALELANSLSTSCGNLGVAIGTALSGWFIATHGVAIAPWVGAAFGLGALALLGLRNWLETTPRNRPAEPATSRAASCPI